MSDKIQVAVRICPFKQAAQPSAAADESRKHVHVFHPNDDTCEKTYQFDAVFGEKASQQEVFARTSKHIVDGALSGYNGTIFAYGQTGSGKTHTMVGREDDAGLIPRTIGYLFDSLEGKVLEANGTFKFSLRCAFVELYGERFYDLLAKDCSRPME
ncbi:kinesin family member 17 [Aphelenchoides avenae]|nr:kinesin family member 17 [Aphelenchus avenae]